MASGKGQAFLDKFAEVSAKIGNQVHLRSLRDGFATIMPIYILAGIAVLINNVVFPLFLTGDGLAAAQYWGNAITQGTLSFAAILLCGVIGYCFAQNKRFGNAIACLVVSVCCLVIMFPQAVNTAVSNLTYAVSAGETGAATQTLEAVDIASTLGIAEDASVTTAATGVISTTNTGANGLFAGIIVSLVATTIFIKISSVEKLKINLGEGVPPAVGKSFNVMIPLLFTLSIFALIGGSGCTFMLLLDTFLFSKNKASRDIAKLSILPGIFNINEPVIYGYPIVYNVALMVPFVILPDIFIAVTYGLTCMGWISPCVVQAPWTTPPVLSALFSTGMDWRAAIWQVIEIAIGMAVWLPFMKVSERAQAKQLEEMQNAA